MRASSRITAKATLLLEDQSPTLDAVIDVCLKWSRNEYAETLLRSLAPAGAEATAEAGLAVVNETLPKWGVKPELYVARDGSGLSRNDYLAPDALIGVLTSIWARSASPREVPVDAAAVGRRAARSRIA